jgi:SAM-dependent methyltransferase
LRQDSSDLEVLAEDLGSNEDLGASLELCSRTGVYKWQYPEGVIATGRRPLSLSQYDFLDIGAGAGRFTAAAHESLGDVGAQSVAVEPSADMRELFEQALPQKLGSPDGNDSSRQVSLLSGNAAGIPLPDSSCHSVFAADAFHWFATPESLFEISRVLQVRGYLGCVWTDVDCTPAPRAGTTEADEWQYLPSFPALQSLRSSTIAPALAHSPYPELDPSFFHAPPYKRGEGWLQVFDNFLGCYFGSVHRHTHRYTQYVSFFHCLRCDTSHRFLSSKII